VPVNESLAADGNANTYEIQLAQGPALPAQRGDAEAAPRRTVRLPEPPAEELAPAAAPSIKGIERPPLPIARGTVGDEDYSPEERINIAVYENCNRSVVNIDTTVVQSRMIFETQSEGSGSGSVLDKQGHILTNYHVIEGAREINVTLFDGKTYDAQLVGHDPPTDVAVIRINAPPEVLFPIRFGDSNRLKVGQRVFAIGNPFGLDRTLTTGIVSSLNRSIPARTKRTMKSIIQIDAAINPGNSGGPLLNSRGQLIGMNTAIASATGQNTGVGFAIPSGTITRVAPQLIERGHVIRPETGVAAVARTDRGLMIARIEPGSPAERAGLRPIRIIRERKRQGPFVYETESIDRDSADIIMAVDGESVSSTDDFLDLVERKRPGEEVTLRVLRQGRQLDVRLRLVASEA
jgi:S1-C subfamily serine protease